MIDRKKYEELIGTVLDERYKLTTLCGIGGMAVVYKAVDLQTNTDVAIKLLNDENSSDERSVRRFVNESKAVAMLSHPNIVNIQDVAFNDTHKYIVMEFLEGITLKDYLKEKGKLDFNEAISYIEQILSALEHAHSLEIVHRDIKPQNIILRSDKRVTVTDFGIAKLPNSDTITLTDKAMGTVFYISPEQASGEPTDFRTDIYSVGIMLYEMVTGKLPFDGETPLAVAMMQVNNEPCEPSKIDPTIPKGLEQIILKAMRKDPSDRFKSAHSMIRAINIFKSNNNVVFEDERKSTEVITKEDDKEDNDKKPDIIQKKAVKKPSVIDEKPIKPKKKPVKIKKAKRTMFPIIFGVSAAFFLVLAVSAVIILMSFLRTQSRDLSMTLTVPQLEGTVYSSSLSNTLKEENFRISNVEYTYSSDHPENTIVSQYPVSGTHRKIANPSLFCDISLVVSLGKQKFPMPDVTVTEYRSAQIKLKNMGLEVKIEKRYDDAVLEGYVISTSVAPGDETAAGETVTLYVSDGQEIKYNTMISVKGQTLIDAKKALELNGFKLGNVFREPSEADTDIVIYQSVAPETKCAEKYTVVDLIVSIKYSDEALADLEEKRRQEEEEKQKQENTDNNESGDGQTDISGSGEESGSSDGESTNENTSEGQDSSSDNTENNPSPAE